MFRVKSLNQQQNYSNAFFIFWFGLAVVFWILFIAIVLMRRSNGLQLGIGHVRNDQVGIVGVIFSTVVIFYMANSLYNRLRTGKILLDIKAYSSSGFFNNLLEFSVVIAGVLFFIFGGNTYSVYGLLMVIWGSQLIFDDHSRIQMCENGIITCESNGIWGLGSNENWFLSCHPIILWEKIDSFEWIVEPILWLGIDDSERECQLKLMLKDGLPLYVFWDLRETIEIEMPFAKKEMAEALLLEHSIHPYIAK